MMIADVLRAPPWTCQWTCQWTCPYLGEVNAFIPNRRVCLDKMGVSSDARLDEFRYEWCREMQKVEKDGERTDGLPERSKK